MELYKYQLQAVEALKADKHFLIAGTGMGKGFISLEWARRTGKRNIVVVTQASKRDSHDFENEAELLCKPWKDSLSSFVVLSWNGLGKWRNQNRFSINWDDYAFIFDECHRAKAGVSSNMGNAFLGITKMTKCWTGYTATPGDNWIDFHAYMVATGVVKTKTAFKQRYCQIATYKGFPEITGYNYEDELDKMWRSIAFFPDTLEAEKELPEATHKTIRFSKPKGYDKVMKTRCKLENDEFIDTTMGLCHYLRQLSATPDKLQWISDFIEGLGERCIVFYNYIEEGEKIKDAILKVLPKSAKVWVINGKTHDIPTADDMGPRDVVLAQWTSGSASLNFQFINYWVSFTPCYSYTVSTQGRGRVRRIGQKKPQFFYYLRCENSIEEDIYRCLASKQDFAESTWFRDKFGGE